jgi:DNA polymerase-3 subunit alpha
MTIAAVKSLGSVFSKSASCNDLFFDTETTGIPAKGADWQADYKTFPYPLSISWKFNGLIHYYLIHQSGRKVPEAATKCNGITTRMANSDISKPARWVYDQLLKDAKLCSNVIGHNVYFDVSIVKADFIRTYGENSKEVAGIVDGLHKDKRIDTMRACVGMFGKWPKLSELYHYLFKEDFEAHDAMADTLAVERVYVELRKRKII